MKIFIFRSKLCTKLVTNLSNRYQSFSRFHCTLMKFTTSVIIQNQDITEFDIQNDLELHRPSSEDKRERGTDASSGGGAVGFYCPEAFPTADRFHSR